VERTRLPPASACPTLSEPLDGHAHPLPRAPRAAAPVAPSFSTAPCWSPPAPRLLLKLSLDPDTDWWAKFRRETGQAPLNGWVLCAGLPAVILRHDVRKNASCVPASCRPWLPAQTGDRWGRRAGGGCAALGGGRAQLSPTRLL